MRNKTHPPLHLKGVNNQSIKEYLVWGIYDILEIFHFIYKSKAIFFEDASLRLVTTLVKALKILSSVTF